MKPKHTEGPYEICFDGQIVGPKGEYICSFRWDGCEEFERDGADAEFIVLACNSHAELLENLSKMLEHSKKYFGIGDVGGSEKLLVLACETAIAKAKGEV